MNCYNPLPDEKGTERRPKIACGRCDERYNPLPDEKGTESRTVGLSLLMVGLGYNPLPDEKGTESSYTREDDVVF